MTPEPEADVNAPSESVAPRPEVPQRGTPGSEDAEAIAREKRRQHALAAARFREEAGLPDPSPVTQFPPGWRIEQGVLKMPGQP